MKKETCLKLIQLGLMKLVENSLLEVSIPTSTGEGEKTEAFSDEFITESDLKLKLRLSSPTLWRYRRQGMPYLKRGKKIYYEFSKVLKFIGGQRNG